MIIIGNTYVTRRSDDVRAFPTAGLLCASHGTHVPWMMSVPMQPIIVRYVGIMIQITTIAEYTRRFLVLCYKTSNYLVLIARCTIVQSAVYRSKAHA